MFIHIFFLLHVSELGGAVKCNEVIGEYEERVQIFIFVS
jgi:hypothetical protein